MKKKVVTLQNLAKETGATLLGDPNYQITGVAPLERANSTDVSFFTVPDYNQPQRYLEQMLNSKAGAIFLAEKPGSERTGNYLVVDNPTLAFQAAIDLFFDEALSLSGFDNIHPSAVIHSTVVIGKNVTVGPNAVIDKECKIGNGSFIGSGCYIGPSTHIGEKCTIHPNVTIRERCTLGNRVTIQPGAVIGSCGFGFTQNSEGKHVKLSQVGDVALEDNVDIGANTTIDRARFTTTRIRNGTKIDNLVQIAHGVDIGENNLIVAQSGIAGSARTGKYVILAAQSGVTGHVSLADGVILAARAGATKSLTAGRYSGVPAVPVNGYNRSIVCLRNIEKYIKEIKQLKAEVEKLRTSS